MCVVCLVLDHDLVQVRINHNWTLFQLINHFENFHFFLSFANKIFSSLPEPKKGFCGDGFQACDWSTVINSGLPLADCEFQTPRRTWPVRRPEWLITKESFKRSNICFVSLNTFSFSTNTVPCKKRDNLIENLSTIGQQPVQCQSFNTHSRVQGFN